ncbi:MAG: PAS domain S-box protein, partial [Ignavibacteriales bacterium]|nr:PAS domain S-box protein [Ignavibacteriales bacterium]
SKKVTELLLLVLLVFIYIFILAPLQLPVEYLCIPLLIWSSFRFGVWLTSLLIFALCMGSIYNTINETGPFYQATLNHSLILLALFNITISVTAIILAVLMTEKDEKVRLVQASENRFRILIESSPIAVAISRDEKIVYANPCFAAMTQYTNENELVGTRIYNLLPVNEHGQFKLLANRSKLNMPMDVAMQIEALKKDGTVFPVQAVITQVELPDGRANLGFFTDLTQQKRNEQFIYAAITEWENTFNAVKDGIALLDTECRLLHYNNAMMRFTQSPESSLTGESFWDALPGIDKIAANKAFEEMKKTASRVSIEMPIGDYFWDFSYDPLLDENGELRGVVLIIWDITERKRAEKNIIESQQQLHDIIEFLPDATLAVNGKGIIIAWNREIENLTGFRAEAMLGKGDFEYAIPLFGRRVPSLIDLIFKYNPDITQNYLFVQRDGDYLFAETELSILKNQKRYISCKAAPLYSADGNCVGAIESIRDITAIKKAESMLLESERKYRELVENANSIIIRWNKYGLISFVNEFGLQFFGFEENEIIGKDLLSTIVPAIDSNGNDQSVYLAELCNTPLSYVHHNIENVTKSGTRVWIAWNNRAVFNELGELEEMLSIGSDITKQREMEEALRSSEKQYRLLFEAAHDAIFLLDDGIIIDCNRTAGRLLGMPREDLIGQSPLNVCPVLQGNGLESEPSMRERINNTLNGDAQFFVWTFLRQDNSRFETEVSFNRVDTGKKFIVLAMFRDITERQIAENQIQTLLAKLQTNALELEKRVNERTMELAIAKDRAESADRLKSAFLATMSHELRTPLNSIIGFTGILLRGLAGPLNPEQLKQLGMAKNSAQHLLALINDVLDITKIEAGEFEIFKNKYDFQKSVEFIAESLNPLAQKKGLAMLFNVDPAITDVYSDKRRVEQILINLVNNGIKFTDKGFVRLDCTLIGNTIEMKVTDSGIGIAPADIEHIFKPFRQIDTGISRLHEGTGLGLSICKALAEKLGGGIIVESNKNIGSKFTVTIPTGLMD